MATEIRYGHVGGGKWGRRHPVAATQYFHPRGSHFVYFDSNGRVTLALTSTATLGGWACVPTTFEPGSTADANGYWTSSATAGADKIFVIQDITAIYHCPTTAAGGLSVQARIGELSDIVGVNDGTAQYVTPGTNTTDVLINMGLIPGETNEILVRINEAKNQKDT